MIACSTNSAFGVDMPALETVLFVYFVLYVLLTFVWRSVLVYRSTGIHPIKLPTSDDAQGYLGRMFKVVLVLCAVHLSIHAWGAGQYKLWPSIAWLAHPHVQGLGWAVLLTSSAIAVVAQAQMGGSWRIGMDTDQPGVLVTHGLFSRSRNPIFLSMRLNLLGLLLVMPDTATMVLLVCAELLLQIQVRLEEDHLSRIYGQSYETYRSKVPRWWRFGRSL